MADVSTAEIGSRAGRIAALLGLASEDARRIDEIGLADTISKGLAPGAAIALGKTLGGNLVVGGIIPEATFRRARKARRPLSREMSERLYEVGRVFEAARHAYGGDADDARAFLTRPHPMLDGRTPLDLARASSAGTDAVVNLLRRAEAGFAV